MEKEHVRCKQWRKSTQSHAFLPPFLLICFVNAPSYEMDHDSTELIRPMGGGGHLERCLLLNYPSLSCPFCFFPFMRCPVPPLHNLQAQKQRMISSLIRSHLQSLRLVTFNQLSLIIVKSLIKI